MPLLGQQQEAALKKSMPHSGAAWLVAGPPDPLNYYYYDYDYFLHFCAGTTVMVLTPLMRWSKSHQRWT